MHDQPAKKPPDDRAGTQNFAFVGGGMSIHRSHVSPCLADAGCTAGAQFVPDFMDPSRSWMNGMQSVAVCKDLLY